MRLIELTPCVPVILWLFARCPECNSDEDGVMKHRTRLVGETRP